MPTVHDLPFVAPVPRGHDVLIVMFTNGSYSPTLLFDRTASTVYCPEAITGALHQDPVLAVTDPVAVVTRFAWTVKSATEGICAGALISVNRLGDRFDAKTTLVVEPPGTPYR